MLTLKDSNRTRLEDKEVATDLSGSDLGMHLLLRVSAKERTFNRVSFRYTIFDNCYLRKCRFQDCDFTGAQWLSRPARGAPAQVPERRPRMGLAMGLPRHASLRRARDRPTAPPSPPRIRAPAGGERCRSYRQDRQAGDVPHLPSLVCHPPAGGEPGHPHRPGASWPPGREHDDDLYPRPEPWARCRPQSGRSDVPVIMASVRGIGCEPSRYIPGSSSPAPSQHREKNCFSRSLWIAFPVIYRTTQSCNAVQDRYS